MPLGSHRSASGAVARGLGSSSPRVSMRSPNKIARTMLVAGVLTALRVIELVVPTSFIRALSMPMFSGRSRQGRQIHDLRSIRRLSKYYDTLGNQPFFHTERRTERTRHAGENRRRYASLGSAQANADEEQNNREWAVPAAAARDRPADAL